MELDFDGDASVRAAVTKRIETRRLYVRIHLPSFRHPLPVSQEKKIRFGAFVSASSLSTMSKYLHIYDVHRTQILHAERVSSIDANPAAQAPQSSSVLTRIEIMIEGDNNAFLVASYG